MSIDCKNPAQIILTALTVSALLSMQSACQDELGPCAMFSHHHFEAAASIEPAELVYQVGDTIRLISVFGDELYERNTDTSYRLIDWDFFPALTAKRMDTFQLDGTIGAFNDFSYIINGDNLDDFTFTQGALFGEYVYANGQYSLSLDIVPKKTGTFMITFGSGVGFEASHQPFDGGCPGLRSEVAVVMNNGMYSNFELLSQSPIEHFNTWILLKPQERFYDLAGYAFKVE